MKRRLVAFGVVGALVLAFAGSAFAFDCIRVSGSLQGLQNSTKSGNWLLFDLSNPTAVQGTFERVVGEEVPADVAKCVADTYATYKVTPYFALGIGVAGGENGGPGVLAGHNKNEKVLANLKGIDHLEESAAGAALFGSLGACGIDVGEEG
jgi:hypothetical protein